MSSVNFKYEDDRLTLDGSKKPSFNNDLGINLHSLHAERSEYSLTSRYYPTTKFIWASENMKKTNRDTIYDFYYNTIDEGYYDFTIIDHRKRVLFEASWNDWKERWNRRYGGCYTVEYNIQSPFGWTPELFDMIVGYHTPSESLDFLVDTDATFNASVIVNYGGDSNIISLNQCVMALTGDNGSSAQQCGLGSDLNYDSTREYNSISLFCQFRAPLLNAGNKRLDLVSIVGGNNAIRLSVIDAGLDGEHILQGTIVNAGDSVTVQKSSGTDIITDYNTWYDACVTYDSVNREVKIYYALASNSSFTRFLDGEDTLTNGLCSYISSAVYPNHCIYDTLNCLKEDVADAMTQFNNVYLQFPMIIDGYITAMQFDMLRRLCYIWNTKTTGYWPK